MSARKVRCPSCSALAGPRPGSDNRYWCIVCNEEFEVHDLPDEPAPVPLAKRSGAAPVHDLPDEDEPPLAEPMPPARFRPRDSAARPSHNRLVVLALAFAAFGLVGACVAGYLALRKDAAPEPVAAVEPAKKEEPTKPPVPAPEPPKKAEPPKKEEPPAPKAPTHDEVVRRVKGATVYIRTPQGTGSGFFAGLRGFVVTNAHVVGYGPREVRPPAKVEVIVASGEADERTLSARVFGVDVESDLALLKVEGENLPEPLAFGRAADLVETQEVVIYGYPFGELLGKNISINRSTVSSLRREGGKLALVQLAGGLNPGNSGGPVTNARGEVIGVSVAKIRGAEAIAFAIPAEDAAAFLRDQDRSGGRFEYGGAVAVAPPPPRPPIRPPVRPPVRPPDDPAGEPVAIGPLRPVAIPDKVDGIYVPKGEPEEAKLPDRVTDVCVGGSGRFLIFHFGGRKLAVFDTRLAKVAKEIPLAEETTHFAAGANRLVVVYPGAKLVQFWNLTTFEKEKSALLPDELTKNTIHQVCMGSACDDTLFAYIAQEKRTFALNLDALKATEVRWNHWSATNAYGPLVMRVSGDGSVLTGRGGGWAGCDVALFEDGKQVGAYAQIPFWDSHNATALPTADGRHVFTSGRVFNRALTQTEWAGGKDAYVVPGVEPGFVLALAGVGKVGESNRPGQAPTSVAVYTEDRQKLFLLRGLGELTGDSLPWEKRVFYYPRSGLLLTLPPEKNRLILRRVDLGTELDRSGADYLAVTSRPPVAVAGKRFEYQLEARSKKGGVKYKLEAGPEGMTLGADGKVVWAEPAGLGKSVNVVVVVSDASGQDVIHSFELGTKGGWVGR